MIPHAHVCPGRCNNAWRLAEAALAADGTPHTFSVNWGQPVHCERCAGRARTHLAELPELIAAISLEALYGTGPRPGVTIRHSVTVSWPGQSARLLTDLIVGGLLELEDDIRDLRGLRPRPARGTEGRNVTKAVRFLDAHLDWAMAEHPAAREVHEHGSGNPASQISDFRAMAIRYTRRDTRLEHRRVPCPRCELLTLYRADGEDYIECRNLACQVLLTPAEFGDHARRLATACGARVNA